MSESVWSERDVAAMRAALQQAARGRDAGEIPVGAVIDTGEGELIGAHNRSIADNDPTGHAEVVALRAAAAQAENYRLADATLYVTLEPCPMCVGAIAHARLRRVVFGAYDEKAGALGGAVDLTESGALNHRFEINGGLLADESEALLNEFFAARR